jgi:hypothetical protein
MAGLAEIVVAIGGKRPGGGGGGGEPSEDMRAVAKAAFRAVKDDDSDAFMEAIVALTEMALSEARMGNSSHGDEER